MVIDDSLILKLEKLSKLRLSEEEREEIKNDLGKILDMINTLESLDTSGVEPLIYLGNEKAPLRNDQVEGEISSEDALKNAPKRIEDYFAVPKVIHK